ncbi:uncharacterized protein LOC133038276 [Cannabis sativa]|uniref:uncharacterized protein LOC133038276 n=1 Tax=Cannabis sativa TaxID=3483 RepID=UPI0029CA08E1|nr:uncharacterized protein LOC133038276 [Cannabis sativa]
MENCKMADLKYSGSFFTWNNKQKPEERIFSTIDRAMVNTHWINVFPSSEVVFLPELSFDHSPILVTIYEDRSYGKKPFRYYNMWKMAPDYDKLVTKSWKEENRGSKMFCTIQKLRRLKAVLKLQNRIFSIEDEHGNWCDSPDKVQHAFLEYYQKLLGSTTPARRKVFQSVVDLGPKVTDCHREILLVDYTSKEVEVAVFSIDRDKAPGLDGYGSAFFQDNWDLVGPDIVEAVISFSNSGKISKEINTTTITLIPKTTCPKSVVDFRPISCCNVVYEIATKVIYNRLRKILPDLIAENQGGFVHGRFIAHNVLVCQDLVRLYGRKNCKPNCMIKIYLRKAYNTIEWEFLEEMMTALGFPGKFINLIMECISTPKFSLLLNGSICGFFNAKRGLRQSDPMSPFPFVSGMEYLSRFFTKVGEWPGFKFHDICAFLKLNHMRFADDLLVFCNGDFISVMLLLKGLKLFSTSSGLLPNEQKTTIYCPGMPESEVSRILEASNFTRSSLPFRYLGIHEQDWWSYVTPLDCSWAWKKIVAVKNKIKQRVDMNGFVMQKYKIQQGYHLLFSEYEKLPWSNLVWDRLIIPKHRFILWLVLWERLNMKERISKYTHNMDSKCLSCGKKDESIDHLFFECDYSRKCLQEIKQFLQWNTPATNIKQLL